MNFKIIRINWLEKKDYRLDSINGEQNFENCLYQAYGDSPIYGRDALLYIGQTNNFKRRTVEHLKTDFSRINNLSLIIGEIDTHIPISDALDISESLLITMLKPSYNSSNIKDTGELLKKDNKFLVLNLQNRGVLPLEVTNCWWESSTINNNPNESKC